MILNVDRNITWLAMTFPVSPQNQELEPITSWSTPIKEVQHGLWTSMSISEETSLSHPNQSAHLQSSLLLADGQHGPVLRSAAMLLWLELMLSSEETTIWLAILSVLYHRKLLQVPIMLLLIPPTKALFGFSISM